MRFSFLRINNLDFILGVCSMVVVYEYVEFVLVIGLELEGGAELETSESEIKSGGSIKAVIIVMVTVRKGPEPKAERRAICFSECSQL